ncbi:MAG: tetraacyldisaccharide 4'-kinase [Lautropia sp.]|nr:tetraacyldisaccharide 4'-kinase [Lautropia sp.]
MIPEGLRQRLEAWLLRVWFRQTRGADRLPALLLAPLALPLSWLVAALARRRSRTIPRTLPGSPPPAVIIVGNLVVGGSGKTPMVLALCRQLRERGLKVGLLARGYRTADEAPRLVDAGTPVAVAGDEALLLASQSGCPVAVSPRRKAALDLLTRTHPELDVVISDDGLQHVALPRRLELVLMHPLGLGNGHCLPAGPLREPASRLASVDALLLPGQMAPAARQALPPTTSGRPHAFDTRTRTTAIRSLDGSQRWLPADFVARHRGQTLAAVAGISRPERFFDTLRTLGLDIVAHPLADHAPISAAWLASLPQPQIIMTAKDAVKCQAFDAALRQRCRVLDIEAEPEPALLEWLIAELAPPPRS